MMLRPPTGRASRSDEQTDTTQGRKRHEEFELEVRVSAVLAALRWRYRCGRYRPQAETPKKGGILKFVVPDEPPSFDGHRETTFALIHPIAPFYSVLIRVDPENPASTTDFVCDLCTEMPKPTDGGKTYTFKIRKGVKFHDGSALTRQGRHASFQRIIFPPRWRAERAQGAISDGRERDRSRRRDLRH